MSTALVFVIATMLLAIGGMMVVRRRIGVARMAEYHDVVSAFLSVIGTLYAVLLGLVVVDTMQRVQELRTLIEQEASGVANMFLVAEGLNDAARTQIRAASKQYAEDVIRYEWPVMEMGQYSVQAFVSAWKLWKRVTRLKPITATESTIHQQLLSEICQMTERRRTRLVHARTGLSPLLWIVILLGGAVTIVTTYFMGVVNFRTQLLLTSLMTLTLSLNVLLVIVYSAPLSGPFGIRPDAFKMTVLVMDHFESEDLSAANSWQ